MGGNAIVLSRRYGLAFVQFLREYRCMTDHSALLGEKNMWTFLELAYRWIAIVLVGKHSIGIPVQIHGRPLSGSITVTAHSGCMELADNSLEAMEAGVRAGAQIVEIDLNYSADGTPVLSHDAPNEEESYVTLEEAFGFLNEHTGVLANVDVKNTEFLEKVTLLAAQTGVSDRIFFTGVEEKDVPIVREKCPGIPYYLNVGVSEDTDLRALAEKTVDLGAVGINIYYKNASLELIRLFHRQKIPVSVWTVNEAKSVIGLALLGADNITTRRPDFVCSVIRQT